MAARFGVGRHGGEGRPAGVGEDPLGGLGDGGAYVADQGASGLLPRLTLDLRVPGRGRGRRRSEGAGGLGWRRRPGGRGPCPRASVPRRSRPREMGSSAVLRNRGGEDMDVVVGTASGDSSAGQVVTGRG